jgi:hypothetical protein
VKPPPMFMTIASPDEDHARPADRSRYTGARSALENHRGQRSILATATEGIALLDEHKDAWQPGCSTMVGSSRKARS